MVDASGGIHGVIGEQLASGEATVKVFRGEPAALNTEI